MKWVNVFTQVFLLLAGDTSNTTAQKMKFSIKYFLSKCDRIRSKLRIWSHLLKKSLMENFIFCAVYYWWVRYVFPKVTLFYHPERPHLHFRVICQRQSDHYLTVIII